MIVDAFNLSNDGKKNEGENDQVAAERAAAERAAAENRALIERIVAACSKAEQDAKEKATLRAGNITNDEVTIVEDVPEFTDNNDIVQKVVHYKVGGEDMFVDKYEYTTGHDTPMGSLTVKTYDAENNLEETANYNAAGKLVTVTGYNNNEVVTVQNYDYDAADNLMTCTGYFEGKKDFIQEFVDGKVVKTTLFNEAGNVISFDEFEWYANGNMSKMTQYAPNGTVELSITYYPNKKMQEYIEYDADNNETVHNYYDSDGHKLEGEELNTYLAAKANEQKEDKGNKDQLLSAFTGEQNNETLLRENYAAADLATARESAGGHTDAEETAFGENTSNKKTDNIMVDANVDTDDNSGDSIADAFNSSDFSVEEIDLILKNKIDFSKVDPVKNGDDEVRTVNIDGNEYSQYILRQDGKFVNYCNYSKYIDEATGDKIITQIFYGKDYESDPNSSYDGRYVSVTKKDGSLITKKYDANNNLVRLEEYADGKLINYEEYDANGNLLNKEKEDLSVSALQVDPILQLQADGQLDFSRGNWADLKSTKGKFCIVKKGNNEYMQTVYGEEGNPTRYVNRSECIDENGNKVTTTVYYNGNYADDFNASYRGHMVMIEDPSGKVTVEEYGADGKPRKENEVYQKAGTGVKNFSAELVDPLLKLERSGDIDFSEIIPLIVGNREEYNIEVDCNNYSQTIIKDGDEVIGYENYSEVVDEETGNKVITTVCYDANYKNDANSSYRRREVTIYKNDANSSYRTHEEIIERSDGASIVRIYDDDNRLKQVDEYNDQNIIIRSEVYHDDNSKTITKFDDNGYRTDLEQYDVNGNCVITKFGDYGNTVIGKYDAKGNEITDLVENNDGATDGKKIDVNDKNVNCIIKCAPTWLQEELKDMGVLDRNAKWMNSRQLREKMETISLTDEQMQRLQTFCADSYQRVLKGEHLSGKKTQMGLYASNKKVETDTKITEEQALEYQQRQSANNKGKGTANSNAVAQNTTSGKNNSSGVPVAKEGINPHNGQQTVKTRGSDPRLAGYYGRV